MLVVMVFFFTTLRRIRMKMSDRSLSDDHASRIAPYCTWEEKKELLKARKEYHLNY